MFPFVPAPAPTREAEAADEGLRAQFTSVGYQVLKESLAESDGALAKEQYLDAEALRFRPIAQAVLASTLAALAPRYAPQLTSELYETSRRLLAAQPPSLTGMAQAQAAAAGGAVETDSGEASIIPAISRGDFGKAQAQIDELKGDAKKKPYAQLLVRAQFKTCLAESDLQCALRTARRTDDAADQMQMLASVAKAANKAGDRTLAAQTLNEARTLQPGPNQAGKHARALFALASEASTVSAADAALVLQDAVKRLNALSSPDKSAGDASAHTPAADDPARFVESAEMSSAFAAVGALDLENTLLTAGRIENRAVQMSARLAAVEKTLAKPPAAKKTAPPDAKTKP